MKLRSRLILGYTVLAVFTSLFVGIFYYHYTNDKYKATIHNNVHFSGMQIHNNLNSELKKMEQVTLALLSDMEVLQIIRELSVDMGDPGADSAGINQKKSIVKNAVYTAYNLENFYRVVVFNQYGYVGASATMQERVLNTETDVEKFFWLEDIKNTKGNPLLVGRHRDDWARNRNQIDVFSMVREIQGNNLGFVEVQQRWEDFEKIFKVPDEKMKVIALSTQGDVIYASEGLDISEYEQYFQGKDQIYDGVNQISGEREVASVFLDEDFAIRLVLVEKWKEAMEGVPDETRALILIVLCFFFPSLIFIILMAQYQTRPLRELRNRMENTELSNLTEKIVIRNSDGDIQSLLTSYQALMSRLETSIEKEKKLSLLQLQAQFDTLQAQINPHFLYNVLNVISSRGMVNDDEIICEICGHLASMLRYSTNTKVRYATIGEELNYVEQYFYLIQARYQDKVKLEADVKPCITNEIIPKTVLQQMVENCINHGFTNRETRMEVKIKGYAREENWYVEVSDNGQGFEEEILKTLNDKMEKTRRRLFQERNNIELEIGGMGLINTYARLLLIYSDSLTFELKNTVNGAVVLIGAKRQNI